MSETELREEFDALETSLTTQEIGEAVSDPEWQTFRASLHGLATGTKKDCLIAWLRSKNYSRSAQVQVMNYKNALRRAGIVPPGQYVGPIEPEPEA